MAPRNPTVTKLATNVSVRSDLLVAAREANLLMTPQLAGIARSELGAEAGALTDQRQTILGAIDFLLTGFSVQPR